MKKLFAAAFALTLGMTGIASAEMTPDEKAAMAALQAQVNAMAAELAAVKAAQQAQPARPVRPPGPPPAERTGGQPFVSLVPNAAGNVMLNIGGEVVQIYGNLDLSIDSTTKGFQSFYPSSGDSPVGNNSYQTAISSNLSYIGVRGNHKIGKRSSIPYQLETQLDISATPGTANTNSNNSADVKGALVSRNSFIGIQTPSGSVKIGKTDAPYKVSTARMNPFNGMLGDYAVIMGNSGGDNRVEFGTRLDHSIWYESPNFHGFNFSMLYSPGQNRASDNSNIAAGESSCTGGNLPGSGALPPACNDGSFGAAYSTALTYQIGKAYLVAAYEAHKNVNRVSDTPTLDPRDVGDETAIKGGIQWAFSKQTTVNAVYESLQRFITPDLAFQNERQRDGFWLSLSQQLSPKDNVAFGWARANPSLGDTGQHNTGPGLNPDNMANMYTIAYRHTIDRHVSWYADWALTLNHPDAHYDLGAGGRGITTDCHDATQLAALDPTTGTISGGGPHCYAGGRLQGFSTGLKVTF